MLLFSYFISEINSLLVIHIFCMSFSKNYHNGDELSSDRHLNV